MLHKVFVIIFVSILYQYVNCDKVEERLNKLSMEHQKYMSGSIKHVACVSQLVNMINLEIKHLPKSVV